jgi:hypothetical protein
MVTDPRQIRRLGLFFFEVDSVFHKNCTAGRVHSLRTRLTFFRKAESTSENPSPERRISRKTAVNCPEYLGCRAVSKWEKPVLEFRFCAVALRISKSMFFVSPI